MRPFTPKDDPYDVYRAARYFAPLDGLRALSVALVALQHARGTPRWPFLNGHNGVTVFFVLSGFLITTLALREEDRAGRVDLRGFYLRRTLRLVPLYALVLGGYCALILGLGAEHARRAQFVRALPYYLTYLQEIPHHRWPGAPLEFLWSLGIEEKFYLVWPLLAFRLARGRAAGRLALALGLAALALTARAWSSSGAVIVPYAHILLGCAAGVALHQRAWFDRLRWLGRPAVRAALVACTVASHLLVQRAAWTSGAIFSSSVALLVMALVISPSRVNRALSARPLVAVGSWSYGIYLTHKLCIGVAEAVVRPGSVARDALALAVGCALSVALSAVLHRAIEQRFVALGRALALRPSRGVLRPVRQP